MKSKNPKSIKVAPEFEEILKKFNKEQNEKIQEISNKLKRVSLIDTSRFMAKKFKENKKDIIE